MLGDPGLCWLEDHSHAALPCRLCSHLPALWAWVTPLIKGCHCACVEQSLVFPCVSLSSLDSRNSLAHSTVKSSPKMAPSPRTPLLNAEGFSASSSIGVSPSWGHTPAWTVSKAYHIHETTSVPVHMTVCAVLSTAPASCLSHLRSRGQCFHDEHNGPECCCNVV